MMTDNSEFSLYDGGDEIVFSSTFNIYSSELKLNKIGGYNLIFNFTKDKNEVESKIDVQPDNEKKEIRITLINFGNTLGSGTTNKISLMTIGSGGTKKEILFSLFGSTLDQSTTFLQVTLTIYVR